MYAIILAGGFGTRLRSAVADVPKPLAPIQGRPFLAWLIDDLKAQGVTSAMLALHHQWEKIRDYFKQNKPPISVNYSVESAPLGTGGGIKHAFRAFPQQQPVIVINGDTFVQVDLRALYQQHSDSGALLTMVLRQVPDTGRYGEVITDNGVITSFAPGRTGQPGLINAGIYVISPELFKDYPMPESFSFERDFLPLHLKALAPRSFLADGYFIDIGIPEDYARACDELPNIISSPACGGG